MLFDDSNNSNKILWIGRKAKTNIIDIKKKPDLIGVDEYGDIIIDEINSG